ncbi:MAG: 16S rRNA (uracil(1498)-N(3))-methyltransferase [Actinomycetota bacterium]|nr:16S rRNA (uracil(1498)-N(3))-methyltransferase [Actinomycetota bacterium]
MGVKAHVFVDDLAAPVLGDGDRHHLERVLRLRPGDPVTVSDGHGGWRPCTFGPVLEPVGEVARSERPSPAVTVAFVPTKGDRPEWAVQKLTEVGVDRIVPVAAARSVVRWSADRAPAHVERLRRVAREAAMQCRRTWLPEVDDLTSFASVAALPGACLALPDGGPPSLRHPVVLVGPEGGWSPEEIGTGLPAVTLGPHVLRAETAAVLAGGLLCALRTGIVTPRA